MRQRAAEAGEVAKQRAGELTEQGGWALRGEGFGQKAWAWACELSHVQKVVTDIMSVHACPSLATLLQPSTRPPMCAPAPRRLLAQVGRHGVGMAAAPLAVLIAMTKQH